jgi:hypothetical protein
LNDRQFFQDDTMNTARILAISLSCAAALCLSTVPLHAQRTDSEWLERCRSGEMGNRDQERYCDVKVERVTGRGTLTVDAHRNGGVSVHGWEGDSIVVHGRIQAQARSANRAEQLAKQVRIIIDGTNVHAEGPDTEGNEWWSVNFDIGVPHSTDLTLQVINGPLGVREVKGTMQLTAQNGPVALRGLAGNVRARVQNGPLSVDLTGARWDGTGLDARATNGPVTLRIPNDYSAHLETGTTNGPMTIDFPITVQGRIPRDLSVDLGQGGPTVHVSTTNGPLHVRRSGN